MSNHANISDLRGINTVLKVVKETESKVFCRRNGEEDNLQVLQ